jgi:hypothetical protein
MTVVTSLLGEDERANDSRLLVDLFEEGELDESAWYHEMLVIHLDQEIHTCTTISSTHSCMHR